MLTATHYVYDTLIKKLSTIGESKIKFFDDEYAEDQKQYFSKSLQVVYQSS